MSEISDDSPSSESTSSDLQGNDTPAPSNSSDSTPGPTPVEVPIFAWGILVIGIITCVRASGVIPIVDESAPRVIAFALGMFCVFFASLLFNLHDRRAMSLFSAGACISIGTVALYCAGFGQLANFDAVIKAFAKEDWASIAYAVLAISIFGFMGVVAWLSAICALIDVFRQR